MFWTECLCPSNIYELKPSHSIVIVFRKGAFERCLGLNEIMQLAPWSDGISVFTEKTPVS